MSFSRSRTRRFLLQSLYTRVIAGNPVSKHEAFFEEPERIDDAYAKTLEDAVLADEGKILSLIYEAAPKYDIKSIPTINALILLICLAEMLVVCPPDVPFRVSVDEAIELAKRYSDDAGKNLINGILNTVIVGREDTIKNWGQRKPLSYSLFHTV